MIPTYYYRFTPRWQKKDLITLNYRKHSMCTYDITSAKKNITLPIKFKNCKPLKYFWNISCAMTNHTCGHYTKGNPKPYTNYSFVILCLVGLLILKWEQPRNIPGVPSFSTWHLAIHIVQRTNSCLHLLPFRQRQKMHKIHLASKPDQESRSGECNPLQRKQNASWSLIWSDT